MSKQLLSLIFSITLVFLNTTNLNAQENNPPIIDNKDNIKVEAVDNNVDKEDKILEQTDHTNIDNELADTEKEEEVKFNFQSMQLYEKGLEALKKENYKKANRLFKRSIREDKTNFKAYNNLGLTYRLLGNIKKAIESYEESIAIAPENSITYNLLGTAFLLNGNNNKCRKVFEKLKKLNPEDPEAYFGLGNLLATEEDYGDSNYNYLKAIDLYTDKENNLKSDTYLNIAINYFRQSKFNDSIDYLAKAVTYNKKNKTGYYYLGLCYLYKSPNDKDKSVRFLKKAMDLGYDIPASLKKIIRREENN